MMANKPAFLAVNEKDTLIYCGYAMYTKNDLDYELLIKILNTDIMWFYLKNTSKNYSGGFKSFAKNYVKNFTIPKFDKSEIEKIRKTKNQEVLTRFLARKYGFSVKN